MNITLNSIKLLNNELLDTEEVGIIFLRIYLFLILIIYFVGVLSCIINICDYIPKAEYNQDYLNDPKFLQELDKYNTLDRTYIIKNHSDTESDIETNSDTNSTTEEEPKTKIKIKLKFDGKSGYDILDNNSLDVMDNSSYNRVYGRSATNVNNNKLIKIGKDTYEGDIVFNKMHGYGKLYNNNNIKYIGNYKNQYKHGYGKSYFTNNNIQYKGMWKNELSDGYGTSYYKNGTCAYKGQFVNNKFHGKGKSYYMSGDIAYDGEFSNNLRHGYGTSYSHDGYVMHRGFWSNGKRL